MAPDLHCDLVLEGGGVKGIGLVGAYAELVDRGYQVHRIAGTSAGALVGSLIAAGISVEELEREMRRIPYRHFEDEGALDRFGIVGKGLSVLFEKGIYEGHFLEQWMDDRLGELGKRTFGHLRITDPDASPELRDTYRLVVMASDVSQGRLARFPWDYQSHYGVEPDERPVADAVRASTSIPFIFEPRPFKDSKHRIYYFVDGGMLSNYPIDVFDRTDGKPPRWPTFGLKLSARPQPAADTRRFEAGNTIEFVKAVLGTMTNFYDQMHIEEPSVLARTIFIDTTGVKATDFGIDPERQELLYNNGRTACARFLDTWDFSAYVARYRSPAPAAMPSRT
jgi:NTE family protein